MQTGYVLICTVVAAVILSAGCLSAIFPDLPLQTPVPASPVPTPVPTTGSPVATMPAARLALQASDLPSDYILKDRSDISYLEADQISKDLGWRAGYTVSYYRINRDKYDLTQLGQQINLYSLDSMNTVYNIRKEAITDGESGTATVYVLPCPNVGDRTIAYRISHNQTSGSYPSYTILFIKKNVCEELSMSGTTTDFETLKSLARLAADKIQ